MEPKKAIGSALIPACAIGCAVIGAPSALALVLGLGIALSVGNPFVDKTRKLSQSLLGYSVIGLGAGMNLFAVAKAGTQGIAFTVLTIGATLALSALFAKVLRVPRDTALLIGVGTAICGGSAIAAVAPVIRAKSQDVSVALATVFLLNAVALVLFPWLGHRMGLTEDQFGVWGALAIHDTSSVVGATMAYGPRALQIGTTIKLARALWIVPLSLLIAWTRRKEETAHGAPANRPWFLLGFLVTATIVTAFPVLAPYGHHVEWVARRALVGTIFLIGANLNLTTLRTLGVRPLVHGVALWICAATATLFLARAGL